MPPLRDSPLPRALATTARVLVVALLLLGAAVATPPPPPTSSALLILDPDANDAHCFQAPQACVEPCASVLRVDVMSDGRAILTPSGPDYKLSCDTGFKSDDPSYQTNDGPRDTFNVSCAAMTARGIEVTWPPPPYPPPPKLPVPPKPALAFDQFDCKGALCRSVFNMPDETLMSGIFSKNGYAQALCHPWRCPTPGCSYSNLFPILVLTVAQPGTGRIHVRPVGRHYGTCLDRRSWRNDSSCTTESRSVTYRILEGRLLNETARPPPSKPGPCPLGTCPRKIFVPPGPGDAGGAQSAVKAGPRDNICVSACDGGGKANATAKAVEYGELEQSRAAFTTCPTDAPSNIGYECEPGCVSWQGPCCALGSTPGPSKDCPACPPGVRVDGQKPAARARLRLVSVIAPNATVACTNFTRMAELELALALKKAAPLTSPTGPGNLLIPIPFGGEDPDPSRNASVGCPPRELTLSLNGACGVELSSAPSSSCRKFNTGVGTEPLTVAPQADGAAGTARAIKDGLVTRHWQAIYDEHDRAAGVYRERSVEGNTTVAALEPDGPGGMGLLALKLNPIGCVYRYVVVEGSLPGAKAAVAAPGAASLPPAAMRLCPGGTTKAAEPAKLAEPGEPVPVCVVVKQ